MTVPYIDIHTHHPVHSEEVISIQSIFLQEIDVTQTLEFPFTAGIHPWHADQFNPEEIRNGLENLNIYPGLIAIGETGLDKKCKVEFDLQKRVFELHIEFAEKIKKPLIIHCVNSWNEMTALSKKSKVPFILHGFNGNIELTRQLIRHGFFFSIGKAILNKNIKLMESVKIIPSNTLFLETDDAALDIKEVYYRAAFVIKCSVEDLKLQISNNYNRLFLNTIKRITL